jgi:hypothetical protein
VLPGKRHLLIALAICAGLHIASGIARRVTPASPGVSVAAEGSFTPGGQYPGEPFAHAIGVRSWGSWSGSDENQGELTIGPFPAPRLLRFGAGGYPTNAGISLHVERTDSSERIPVTTHDVGERWRIVEVSLPKAWEGRSVRLRAVDASRILGGWIAVSEPIRGGRGDGNAALIETLAGASINALLLGVMFFAALRFVVARGGLASYWAPLAAAAIVALAGYAVFWAYFANALLGVIFSWALIAVTAAWLWLGGRTGPPGAARTPSARDGGPAFDEASYRSTAADVSTVLKVMLGIGALYLGLLHLFPTQHDFYTLAANRYREALPSDNVLSHGTAERLFASESLKNPDDEWLASDRPPLQAGWQLLTWPASKLLGLDRRTTSATSAFWFQLLWIAAAYGLLRTLQVERLRAAGWIAAMALSGFFLQNTTFTWPKLSSAAFACGAFALFALRTPPDARRTHAIWAALFAALAWLSHGGVAFSFLALMPLVLWRLIRRDCRGWAAAAVVVLLLTLPWLAFQKLYDPPGNRLLKWHLAGAQEKDARGTWETIRASYARTGWPEVWANKASNFHSQVLGDWRELIDLSPRTALDRRTHEFFHTARALAWWPLAALLAIATTRRRWLDGSRDLLVLGGWLALTITIWCLLMFGRYQASIHHGSYAMMVGLFVVCAVILERTLPAMLPIVAGLQAVTLATTWALGNATIGGPPVGLGFVIVTALVLGYVILRGVAAQPPVAGGVAPSASPDRRWLDAMREWWRTPRLNLWVVAAIALLCFLRKPHAVHTPQLWAEDGSIFVMQADLLGAEALATPYMGYLHTIPRIVAWLASNLLDPLWWPAFYNGIAFVVWVAVLARLFTSRFDLPGKPWLALAFLIVPHSGEVYFNVTNLQWVMAFVLIQQAIIAPPRSRRERITDLIVLALVALTGPFGLAFLPLFAWRWWNDRRADNTWAFAVMLLCAAVQAWFVIRTAPRFDYQAVPLAIGPNLVILARRLVVWPVLGNDLAMQLSPTWIAVLGGGLIAALLVRALLAFRRCPARALVAAAFGLITLAAIYRTRPDTWAADNLDFGDRYFYIPRVLIAWLLIFEFHASRRAIAVLARVLGLTALLVHVRDFVLPSPPDYHWAKHVDPIRRGVRADIPTLPEGWTLEYHGRKKR